MPAPSSPKPLTSTTSAQDRYRSPTAQTPGRRGAPLQVGRHMIVEVQVRRRAAPLPRFVPVGGPCGPAKWSVELVDSAPMINVYDRDRPRLVVDPVDNPVTAAASAVPVVQWRQ